jgi:RimJ/RimL family protein N-acetyltransferase
MLVFTTDKERLLRHFRKDPSLFAYHIGDLDPFHFPDTQWAVLYSETAKVEDAVLTFYGSTVPVILAFGLTDRFESLLSELLEISPRQFYCHFQPRSRQVLENAFRLTSLRTTWRMTLKNPQATTGRQLDVTGFQVARLDRSHEPQLRTLYASSFPESFFIPRMLDTGKYFGAFDRDRIVAVAGVHFDSTAYRCAALGNIVTDTAYRGRGLASLVTGQLCRELLAEEKQISLNVSSSNPPAIHCYENLGFVKMHEFQEALCELP